MCVCVCVCESEVQAGDFRQGLWAGGSGPGGMGGLEPLPGVVSSLGDWEREINTLAAAPCLAPHPNPNPAF